MLLPVGMVSEGRRTLGVGGIMLVGVLGVLLGEGGVLQLVVPVACTLVSRMKRWKHIRGISLTACLISRDYRGGFDSRGRRYRREISVVPLLMSLEVIRGAMGRGHRTTPDTFSAPSGRNGEQAHSCDIPPGYCPSTGVPYVYDAEW